MFNGDKILDLNMMLNDGKKIRVQYDGFDHEYTVAASVFRKALHIDRNNNT
jgi:hypothetical protein